MKLFVRNKLPFILCFLVVIAFSLKNLREPDLWWQIKTGEWIVENKQVPKTDIFSYTFEGKPWVNIKWGSEVLFAVVSKLHGPESVFMLQLFVSCLLLYVLYLLCITIVKKFKPDQEINNPLLAFSLLTIIYGIEYRIIGRPEMFSHLFTAVFLLLLFRHETKNNKEIFWLIPLQLLWANMHEAFGMGLVLLLIFTFASWFNRWYGSRNKIAVSKPLLLSLAFILACLSILINPNGIDLALKPFNIFGQVLENKFTTELMDYTSYMFWNKEAYIAIVVTILSVTGLLIFFFTSRNKKEKPLTFIVRNNFTVQSLLLVAFFYLASTAYRNIIFLLIIEVPLLFFALTSILPLLKNKLLLKISEHLYLINICIALFFYVSIVSGKYYEWFNRNDRYGLEVVSNINPTGAADFIERNKLTGNVYCDYLSSSYLLWKLYPSFKSFIDLRDLDVFSNEFFYSYAESMNDPDAFKKLDSTYHFRYAVVLANSQMSRFHKFIFSDSTFSLAFIDPVAAVYVRSKVKNNIGEFSSCKPFSQSTFAFVINKIFNPFYKPFNYEVLDNDLLAATFYNMLGDIERVKDYAFRSMTNAKEKYQAYELLTEVYYNYSINDTNTSVQSVMMDSAKYFLDLSIRENPDYAAAYMDQGAISFREKRLKEALKNFEKAASIDNTNLNTFIYAAQTATALANQGGPTEKKYTELAIEHYKKADRLNPNNPVIMSSLGFLYYRIKDCDHAVQYLEPVKDFEGLSEQERMSAKQFIKNCGN